MKVISYIIILMLAACAAGPQMREPAELPKDAVTFEFGYSTAFDRIVKALEAEGYRVAIADVRAGLIQTEPKESAVTPSDSKVQYHGMYRIYVDGDRDRSWAIIRLLVIPELPEERERIIRRLQGNPPTTP